MIRDHRLPWLKREKKKEGRREREEGRKGENPKRENRKREKKGLRLIMVMIAFMIAICHLINMMKEIISKMTFLISKGTKEKN